MSFEFDRQLFRLNSFEGWLTRTNANKWFLDQDLDLNFFGIFKFKNSFLSSQVITKVIGVNGLFLVDLQKKKKEKIWYLVGWEKLAICDISDQ